MLSLLTCPTAAMPKLETMDPSTRWNEHLLSQPVRSPGRCVSINRTGVCRSPLLRSAPCPALREPTWAPLQVYYLPVFGIWHWQCRSLVRRCRPWDTRLSGKHVKTQIVRCVGSGLCVQSACSFRCLHIWSNRGKGNGEQSGLA